MKSTKKLLENQKLILKNLILFLVIAVTAFIACWTWFVSVPEAKASGLSVMAAEPGNLEVKVQLGANGETLQDWTTDVFTLEQPIIDPFPLISGSGVNFYRPLLNLSGEPQELPDGTWNLEKDSTDMVKNTDFIEYHVSFRTKADEVSAVYLDTGSMVEPDPATFDTNLSDLGDFSRNYIAGATRVAFFTSLTPSDSNRRTIWIPNKNYQLIKADDTVEETRRLLTTEYGNASTGDEDGVESGYYLYLFPDNQTFETFARGTGMPTSAVIYPIYKTSTNYYVDMEFTSTGDRPFIITWGQPTTRSQFYTDVTSSPSSSGSIFYNQIGEARDDGKNIQKEFDANGDGSWDVQYKSASWNISGTNFNAVDGFYVKNACNFRFNIAGSGPLEDVDITVKDNFTGTTPSQGGSIIAPVAYLNTGDKITITYESGNTTHALYDRTAQQATDNGGAEIGYATVTSKTNGKFQFSNASFSDRTILTVERTADNMYYLKSYDGQYVSTVSGELTLTTTKTTPYYLFTDGTGLYFQDADKNKLLYTTASRFTYTTGTESNMRVYLVIQKTVTGNYSINTNGTAETSYKYYNGINVNTLTSSQYITDIPTAGYKLVDFSTTPDSNGYYTATLLIRVWLEGTDREGVYPLGGGKFKCTFGFTAN